MKFTYLILPHSFSQLNISVEVQRVLTVDDRNMYITFDAFYTFVWEPSNRSEAIARQRLQPQSSQGGMEQQEIDHRWTPYIYFPNAINSRPASSESERTTERVVGHYIYQSYR